MMNFHKILLISASLFFALATDSFAQKAKRPDTFYYRLGVEAFQQNKNDISLEYFHRDLKENPENVYSQTYLGIIECSKGKYAKALGIFDTIIGKIPASDSYFKSLIHYYEGKAQTGLGNYDDAFRSFSKVLEANRKDPLGYEGRGYLYLKMNDFDSAEKDFNQALHYDRENVQSLLGLGHIELAKGDIPKAIEKYGNVIEQFDKKCPDAYAYRADAYIQQWQYKNAAADIASALIIDKNNSKAKDLLFGIIADSAYHIVDSTFESHNDITLCYYQGIFNEITGHYTKAIEKYGKLLCQNDDKTYYYLLSKCYLEMDNFVAAKYYAENGWRNDTTDFNLTLQKAKINLQLGHLQAAASDAERLIKAEPNNEKSYYYSGYYESRNKQYGKALNHFTKAISMNPDMADAYFGRGVICQKYGQLDAAKADFEKVVELENGKATSTSLMFAYLHLGETEKAEQMLNDMLIKNPNDKIALYNAACIYARLGDENKAVAFLEDAFKNGLLKMNEMKTDSDLDPIRENETYKELVAHYDSLFIETNRLPELIYKYDKNNRKNSDVDMMPEFPGGEMKLLEYIAMNVKYPEIARQKGISGRVFVTFIVEPDGSISNVGILKGIGSSCDQEAYRVVKAMPKWNPGEKDGKKVRVSYMLPINFQIR